MKLSPFNGFNQGVMHLLFIHLASIRSKTLNVPQLQEVLDNAEIYKFTCQTLSLHDTDEPSSVKFVSGRVFSWSLIDAQATSATLFAIFGTELGVNEQEQV